MRKFIVVGHGELPVALVNSAKMIVGDSENIFVISLQVEDGKDELEAKFDTIYDEIKDYEVIVFVDLFGGSPANAAIQKYMYNDAITILSGMNLPMFLTAILTPNVEIKELLEKGKEGILDIKAQLHILEEE